MPKLILLLLFFCLPLSGCLGSGVTTVDAVNEADFRTFAQAMQPELTRRNLLNPDGTWNEPLLTVRDLGLKRSSRAGEILLDQLSPAFRFPNLSQDLAPRSFRQTFTSDAQISISRSGFSAMQGLDEIKVELVAALDWNQDGQEDWLLICRIIPSDRPGYSRAYYLIVEDTRAELLLPRVLGYLDCVNYRCQFYLPDGSAPVFVDSNAVVYEPGQQEITAPPQTTPAPANSGSIGQTRLEN